MPELNDCKGKLKHFTPADASVDIYAIPYLDKVREAARQKRLAAELAAGGKNAKQIKTSSTEKYCCIVLKSTVCIEQGQALTKNRD